MLNTRLAGCELALLPGGAAYLPSAQALLVADAHFGKAVSFRRLGMPVPRGTTTETLDRLDALVHATGARQVVFLGDFLHSAQARAPATLAALSRWRADHAALTLTLVRGNHDERAGDPPEALGIQVVDEPWPLAPFALCHHPQAVAGAYVLAGHWHPCISLHGRANERLRLPCFWFGDDSGAVSAHAVGILPAFGGFTGMHPVAPRAGDRLFAIAGDQVREVSPRA
ncbi:MAG: ligase-associated DNA damage response endonuclease PdeM [Ramlibacter sp.]